MIDALVTVAQIVSAVGIVTICAAALAHVLAQPAPTWDDDEPVLCGECSDDMETVLGEWPEFVRDIEPMTNPADRVRCAQCGN